MYQLSKTCLGFFALLHVAVGITCLPDAIPESQRQNITIAGVQMPLGVTTGDWDSAIVARDLYGILVSEVLGYNVVLSKVRSSNAQLHAASGCSDVSSLDDCSWPPTVHAALEMWPSTVTSPTWAAKAALLGERAAEIVGTHLYVGYDGMFVLGRANQRSEDATGMHLTYYGNYNATWFSPENYAATVADVDISFLRRCVDSISVGYTNAAEVYLNATGDTDGVITINNTIHYKCWQEKWLVVPACRADPTRCISVVSGADGWGIREMSQKAFFYNMPVAFAVANSTANWLGINKQLQSLLYAFTPDSRLQLYSPKPIQFPELSAAEFNQGIFRTMNAKSTLYKAASSALASAADRARGLLANLALAGLDMEAMLTTYAQSSGPDGDLPPDGFLAACTWALANRDLWEKWVPKETDCSSGLGLVDLQQNFVTEVSAAVECATCPPGRASVKSGNTRVCSKCAAGSSQNAFGGAECNSCIAGSYASQEASTECALCGLGEYANATGMSACYRCGVESGQPEMWTTSQEVTTDTGIRIIEVQGATSESFCSCEAGSYLWQGICQVCSEGTSCPGGNRLELLFGYFSTEEAPGTVFQCFYDAFCPGGPPGTCAAGRDVNSVACYDCQDGSREKGDGTCESCGHGDYAFFACVMCMMVLGVTALYIGLRRESASSPSGQLLVISTSLTQLLTLVQMLSVLRRFEVDWREPFSSVLVFFEVLSFDVEMLSVSCVTTMSPPAVFASRSLLIPFLMLTALVVHLLFLLITRSKTFQLSALWRTMGTTFLIFFIVLFAMLLAPFQCSTHPTADPTLKRYGTVFCNGEGAHLQMFIIGGFACLMPVIFLAVCTWIVIVLLPRRLARSDARFLESCSFLIRRFRPGAEIASVLFLIRNSAVALCPLVLTTSGQLLTMSLILYVNFFYVAYVKPWRSTICNLLDCVLVGGMLVILDMGSTSVKDSNPVSNTFVVMLFLTVMLLSILGTILHGAFKYFQQKYRKQFRFFLCHQKNAAGSMARLLKMELEARLPGTKTFIDCDDLNDLTRLFSYVGQDTDTFLVLGSPAILTRKWCVGEMVTALRHNVKTLLLTWPDFTKPDEKFIENYTSLVPDINELTKYGISLSDVEEAFRWLRTVEDQSLPAQIDTDSIADVVSALVSSERRQISKSAQSTPKSSTSRSSSRNVGANCPVLVDPDDGEAVATAMVLSSFLQPKMLAYGLPFPLVLQKGSEVSESTQISILICSNNCFKSAQVQEWLLQASRAPSCGMIPVIAEDSFLVPSPALYGELRQSSELKESDFQEYCLVIKAVFQEIAVVFVPQNYSSTHDDLQLRASQAAVRLKAKLQPLATKVSALSTRILVSEAGAPKGEEVVGDFEITNEAEKKGEDYAGGGDEELEDGEMLNEKF
eukprot:symbB.v1.2.023175.t1/scaffold2102.1/size90421/5